MNPFIECCVLPIFIEMCALLGAVSSSDLAVQFGVGRKQGYNYLNAIRKSGRAELRGKRWVAV